MSDKFNSCQTPLGVLLVDLPTEVISNIYKSIEELRYIKNLISEHRPTIDTVEKEDGLVKIDFSNPHILSDMDYFRQPALHFQKYGKYTDALHSTHPKSG